MTKPIPDRAEIAEYPYQLYLGAFEQTAALFAGIMRDWANTVAVLPPVDMTQGEALRHAAKAFPLALEADAEAGADIDDTAHMTPAEEVLLLHVLE